MCSLLSVNIKRLLSITATASVKPGTYALQLLSACAAVIELLIAINLTVKFKKFVDTISQLM